MVDVIKLRILIFDYTQRRRHSEDGAEGDLKFGVIGNVGSNQRLEEAMSFSSRVFRGKLSSHLGFCPVKLILDFWTPKL